MEKDRKAFENKINVEAEAVNIEVELRTRELLRLRDEKQEAQEAEERRRVPQKPMKGKKGIQKHLLVNESLVIVYSLFPLRTQT